MEGTQLASEVMDEIQTEIEETSQEMKELQAQLPALRKAKDDAWEAYSSDPDAPIDPKAERAYDAAWNREQAVHTAISNKRNKIQRLRSPDEFDLRMEQHAKQKGMHKVTEATKAPKKPTAKDQGVPDAYLGESGNFKIGMDARLKSDLVNAILEQESPDALHEFTPAEAQKLVEARGWQGFVDRKREILEAKAAKTEERNKAKEEAARERAAAKEAKAKEKKAASDAKKKEPVAAAPARKKGDPDPK